MNRIGGPKYSTVDDIHMEKDLKNRTQHIYISHDNVYRQNSICESIIKRSGILQNHFYSWGFV